MDIRVDDLSGSEITALLLEHVRCMSALSPPESTHVLDIDNLRKPEIAFWTAWEGTDLMGCAALKELSRDHGEIKSMRTSPKHLRKGVATKLLQHIIVEARRRGYRQLSLETGSMRYCEPARALYSQCGFKVCGPFGDYAEDPNSVFMTKHL